MKLLLAWTTMAASAAFVGCAGYSVPAQHVAAPEAAIRGATEIGAAQHPKAATYLRLAEDELRTAKSLLAQGEDRRADLALERAQADAELALALAHQGDAEGDADRAIQKVRALRDQSGKGVLP